MSWVLDASAAYLATQDEGVERGADATRELLHGIEGSLLAPRLLAYELAHVIFAKHPTRIEDARQRISLHHDLVEMARPCDPDWAAIDALCQEHGITAYDATYLELAQREDGVLITNDAVLHKAALEALGEGRSVFCRDSAN